MTFTVAYKAKFAGEFANLKQDQQDKVLDFTDCVEKHGLSDFSKFPGKITPSWKGVHESSPEYAYAYDNSLWHYHVGLPNYKQSISGKYLTSDWVLHFQWIDKDRGGTHITLVDLYSHWTHDGKFWLPQPDYLED